MILSGTRATPVHLINSSCDIKYAQDLRISHHIMPLVIYVLRDTHTQASEKRNQLSASLQPPRSWFNVTLLFKIEFEHLKVH